MPSIPSGSKTYDLSTPGGRLAAALAESGRSQPQITRPAPTVGGPAGLSPLGTPGAVLPDSTGGVPDQTSQGITPIPSGAAGVTSPETVGNELSQLRGLLNNNQSTNQAPTGQSRPSSSILGQLDFGPLEPLTPRYAPGTPEADGGPRIFQYPVGTNILVTPRAEFPELAPFYQLKNIAASYDVCQLCIAARAEQLQGMGHSVVANDKRRQREFQDACDTVEEFFVKPDGVLFLDQWLASLVREHLVTDAVTVYPHLDVGGDLYAVEAIDGAGIKPLLDDRGRTMAYQQILYGYPFTEYKLPTEQDRGPVDFPTWSTNELLYLPRFTSTWYPYGYPPSEWIIMRVNQALRKQIFDIAYFTHGNIPDMIATMPEGSMQADQIAQFEILFNAMLAGNDQERRKVRFVPFSTDIKELRPFSFETNLDEWMLRVTCAAYAVPPQELGFTQDVNRATAELQEAVNERRGLKPLSTWFKNVILDNIIHTYFGRKIGQNGGMISAPGMPTRAPINPFKKIGWQWQFGDKADANTVAQTDDLYMKSGVISPDETRAMRFGQELEGPSPATLALQAKDAASAAAVTTAGGGKYPIPMEPVPGSAATPGLSAEPSHNAQDMPIDMPAVHAAAGGDIRKVLSNWHWSRDLSASVLSEQLDKRMRDRMHSLRKRGSTAQPRWTLDPAVSNDLLEDMGHYVDAWVRKAIHSAAPEEFLRQFDYETLELTVRDFMDAKAIAALQYGAEPLWNAINKGEEDIAKFTAKASEGVAEIWATLLDNATVIAAFAMIGKSVDSNGHLVMQPPRHINCRCKLRVRKVELVAASPAPRTQAEQPTVPKQLPKPAENTIPAEPDAADKPIVNPDAKPAAGPMPFGDRPIGQTPLWDDQAGDDDDWIAGSAKSRLRKDWASEASDAAPANHPDPERRPPEEAWVAYWVSNSDEKVCTKPYTTPWGGVVNGCKGLNGLVVTTGPLLGHTIPLI